MVVTHVCQRLPGQADDLAVLAAGQVQRYQRQRGVHVTAAVVDQPFGVGKPALQHSQLGECGPGLAVDARAAACAQRGGQAQRDLGVLPAPDITQDLAHRRAAVRVDVGRPVLDAESQLVLGDPGPLVCAGEVAGASARGEQVAHDVTGDERTVGLAGEDHRHGLVQPGHPFPDRGQGD